MNDVDTVAAVMKFPSGTIAIIDTSRDAKYGYDQRIEVSSSHSQGNYTPGLKTKPASNYTS